MSDALCDVDDKRLMVLAAEGSQAAFGQLVERHQARVAGHVRRLVGPRDCDDLTQNTFIRAWRYRTHYDARHSLIGWLLVIASRLSWNHLRERKTNRFVSLESCGDVPRLERSPATQLAEHDRQTLLETRLESALDGLQPQVRTLYELYYRQELSVGEIAEHFATSSNAVKQRLHRLRQALRQALQECCDED